MRNPFEDILRETGQEVSLVKKHGEQFGPFVGILSSESFTAYDVNYPFEEGDMICTTYPNGIKAEFTILEVEYSAGFRGQVPSSYTLKLRKTTSLQTQLGNVTNNYIAAQHNGTGDIRGVVQNTNSTLTDVIQSIGESANFSQDKKAQLADLMEQLKDVLSKVPDEQAEAAEAVADSAKVLVDAANKEKPNLLSLSISADGLKAAAKNIIGVAPAVWKIATSIIALAHGQAPPILPPSA